MILDYLASAGIGLLAGAGVREAVLAGFEKAGSARRRIKPAAKKETDLGILIGRGVADALPGGLTRYLLDAWGGPIEKQLSAAGRPDIEPADIIGLRLVLMATGPVAAIAWSGVTRTGIALSLLAAALLQRWPDAWLKAQATVRSRAFSKLLPEFTELVALGIKAGLSLDRSIELYCDHFKNPVAEVFSLALNEMAVGKPRRGAFRAAADSNRIEALTALISSILRAEKLGSPLSGVLLEQARAARESHEASVRELSATAPVKMLGPIAGLILPALLIVIIGPALLHFI